MLAGVKRQYESVNIYNYHFFITFYHFLTTLMGDKSASGCLRVLSASMNLLKMNHYLSLPFYHFLPLSYHLVSERGDKNADG